VHKAGPGRSLEEFDRDAGPAVKAVGLVEGCAKLEVDDAVAFKLQAGPGRVSMSVRPECAYHDIMITARVAQRQNLSLRLVRSAVYGL
jgi:hypothetical protein